MRLSNMNMNDSLKHQRTTFQTKTDGDSGVNKNSPAIGATETDEFWVCCPEGGLTGLSWLEDANFFQRDLITR